LNGNAAKHHLMTLPRFDFQNIIFMSESSFLRLKCQASDVRGRLKSSLVFRRFFVNRKEVLVFN
jgi:hypothetical protein